MRIKIFIVIFIIATVGLSFRTVIGRTPVSNNTKVQEALADSLNDNGRWIKQHYTEGAAQATPPSGTAVTYVKTDGKLYLKDDAGTETDLTAAAGTIDGTGTTNELVYWVDSDTLGALAVATYPSLAELAHGKGVTSAIQTQLDAKAPSTSPTFATSITGSFLTASEILITDGSKNIVSAAVATYPSLTELAYMKGVTSAIQTQLGLKAPLASPTFTGTVTIPTPFTIGAVSMTSTGTELNILDGATLTVTELNYVDGVTSAIQTQLDAKAPLDSPVFTTAVTLPVGLTGVIRADTGVVSVDTDVTDLVTAASLTAAGKAELATTAEINTGTDTTRIMPIDQYVASNRNVRYPMFRIVEATTAVAQATTKGGDWEVPYNCTITGIGAYNDTAGTTGTMTIDVNKNGTTLMTTNKITIDTAEKTSRTAAVAPALTTTTLAVGDIVTIDIDAIHSGTPASGLTIWLSIRMD